MGQTGSRVASKIASSFSFSGNPEDEEMTEEELALAIPKLKRATALIYNRRGSMYFDEDGDLAHEFYEEVPKKKGLGKRMKKVHDRHLKPQGDVPYAHPRLHVDFPIIMYQG